jgi:excisionase family DNA binding protein
MTTTAWLTPPQIAKELHIRDSKVAVWIARGELVAVNVAERPDSRPRWRVKRQDLDDFLQRRQSQAPPPKPIRRRRRDPHVIQFF